MTSVRSFIRYLPSFSEIESIFGDNNQEASYIIRNALADFEKMQGDNDDSNLALDEESVYLVQALRERYWEKIHTGIFSEVPENVKKIYTLTSFLRVLHMYFETDDLSRLENCSEVLDEAVLLGSIDNLYANSDKLRSELEKTLNELLDMSSTNRINLPTLAPLQREVVEYDIPTLDCPSIKEFKTKCLEKKQPTLLFNTIKNWPALDKWRDLNYILKAAGNRLVPIEIGEHYAADEWSQQLLKIKDFLQRQFSESAKPDKIEYLAQHELFKHIPELMSDIIIPEYCNICEATEPPEIKAWLGPKGTISPMHYDKKYNLLCQVFGKKTIILASPEDTDYLYAFESRFLYNTAQIDAANPDYDTFPLAKNVKFLELKLQEGDCLYIPPKWWHYVRSEAPSFSVSFWWK